MSGADKVRVRGLCVRRDLGDMGLFSLFITVSVLYSMSPADMINWSATGGSGALRNPGGSGGEHDLVSCCPRSEI